MRKCFWFVLAWSLTQFAILEQPSSPLASKNRPALVSAFETTVTFFSTYGYTNTAAAAVTVVTPSITLIVSNSFMTGILC